LKNIRTGEYKLRWFDCAIGNEVTEENVTVADGDLSWDKLNNIGNELAVYIERIGGIMKGIR
jgi:hypothetical protein